MRRFREQRNWWICIFSVTVYYILSRYSALLARFEDKKQENLSMKTQLDNLGVAPKTKLQQEDASKNKKIQ